MLKEGLQYLVNLGGVEKFEFDGIKYTDAKLFPVEPPMLATISTKTLQGLVDYYEILVEKSPEKAKDLMVHVFNPVSVSLLTWMAADKQTLNRQYHISAEAATSNFPYDKFLPQEDFIIKLNACFVHDDNLKSILSIVSSVLTVSEVSEEDDGVGQKLETKSGASLKEEIVQKNPINLSPWTTFAEVDQPEDSFVFRVKKAVESKGATFALFKTENPEIDRMGIKNVAEWLDGALNPSIPVIA